MKSNLNVFFLVIVVEFCSRSLTVASLVMIFIQQLNEMPVIFFVIQLRVFVFTRLDNLDKSDYLSTNQKQINFLFKLTLYLIFILYKFRQ